MPECRTAQFTRALPYVECSPLAISAMPLRLIYRHISGKAKSTSYLPDSDPQEAPLSAAEPPRLSCQGRLQRR